VKSAYKVNAKWVQSECKAEPKRGRKSGERLKIASKMNENAKQKHSKSIAKA
jgi:type IV secretory pathway VirJ component